MKKKIFIVILFSLLLAGCASAKSETQMYEMPAAAPQMEEARDYAYEDSFNGKTDYSSASGVDTTTVERLVIKNAYLNIAVANPVTSLDQISKMADSMGGFVVSSNVYKTTLSSGIQVPQGNITIRIPSIRLDEALTAIKKMAVEGENGIISENVSGQDVTSDYVDSQSRLKNLEAAESQLVELLDSAPDLQYTLEIFRELTSIRSEIEVLKGHIKYLEESSALSAITIDLVAEETLQPLDIGGWKPKGIAREALQALINTLQWIGKVLIWFGIYCLPFLIPLGVGVFIIFKIIKKGKAKKIS